MSYLIDMLRHRLSLGIFNPVGRQRRGTLRDSMAPRGDDLQLILSRRGEPKAAIYVDNKQEFRSPALQEGLDAPTSRNS